MLVLSRHRSQQIIIRGDIVITVVGIDGDRVRIGVDAPKGVAIHRREVQELIDREKTAGDHIDDN